MPARGDIHIGTSGWNYGHWKGPFYPEDLPQKKWLGFYGGRLRSVEVNNTFYSLPQHKTLRTWTDAVPSDFVFSVKASRYITHMKKMKDPEESLRRFLDAVEALGERLGPVLFQLPPSWRADPERLERFLEALPGELRCAFEFRDESWFDNDILELLRSHGAAFCVYHLAGRLSPKEVTADFVYLRLHGPGDRYEGSYDQSTLSGWAGALSSWARRGLDVYCYFDNDDSGYAALNAVSLADMLDAR
ncbi:MAG: DUF72 domain-containing protein [Candidatus Eisenbacteria bacterium]|nr:DUF72 domain-containing protein [Candidatus Eisenbacteria bacterium]